MPASSILNRMEKGEIVSMKDKMSSFNSFIHHQKINLTLIAENVEVLKTYRKREKISLLKGSVESLRERRKIMNNVALAIMEEGEKDSKDSTIILKVEIGEELKERGKEVTVL